MGLVLSFIFHRFFHISLVWRLIFSLQHLNLKCHHWKKLSKKMCLRQRDSCSFQVTHSSLPIFHWRTCNCHLLLSWYTILSRDCEQHKWRIVVLLIFAFSVLEHTSGVWHLMMCLLREWVSPFGNYQDSSDHLKSNNMHSRKKQCFLASWCDILSFYNKYSYLVFILYLNKHLNKCSIKIFIFRNLLYIFLLYRWIDYWMFVTRFLSHWILTYKVPFRTANEIYFVKRLITHNESYRGHILSM